MHDKYVLLALTACLLIHMHLLLTSHPKYESRGCVLGTVTSPIAKHITPPTMCT